MQIIRTAVSVHCSVTDYRTNIDRKLSISCKLCNLRSLNLPVIYMTKYFSQL